MCTGGVVDNGYRLFALEPTYWSTTWMNLLLARSVWNRSGSPKHELSGAVVIDIQRIPLQKNGAAEK